MTCKDCLRQSFQSTLPVRGATACAQKTVRDEYISIHAPREGSDAAQWLLTARGRISIHAPREGSDYSPSFLCNVL